MKKFFSELKDKLLGRESTELKHLSGNIYLVDDVPHVLLPIRRDTYPTINDVRVSDKHLLQHMEDRGCFRLRGKSTLALSPWYKIPFDVDFLMSVIGKIKSKPHDVQAETRSKTRTKSPNGGLNINEHIRYKLPDVPPAAPPKPIVNTGFINTCTCDTKYGASALRNDALRGVNNG